MGRCLEDGVLPVVGHWKSPLMGPKVLESVFALNFGKQGAGGSGGYKVLRFRVSLERLDPSLFLYINTWSEIDSLS